MRGITMNNKASLVDLLKDGEILYLNYISESIIFGSKLQPGTRDSYTHYLYFHKKTGFLYRFNKKSQKTEYISAMEVQSILNHLEQEQMAVENLLDKGEDSSLIYTESLGVKYYQGGRL